MAQQRTDNLAVQQQHSLTDTPENVGHNAPSVFDGRQVHFHHHPPFLPTQSTQQPNFRDFSRQRGDGSLIGSCLGCRRLILETTTKDNIDYVVCDADCSQPTVIHKKCALNALIGALQWTLLHKCTHCQKTIVVKRYRRFPGFSWLWRNLFNPVFFAKKLFWLLVYLIFIAVLSIGTTYVWKAITWCFGCWTLSNRYYADPRAFNYEKPVCLSMSSRTYSVTVRGKKITSNGFDQGHLMISYCITSILLFFYYATKWTLVVVSAVSRFINVHFTLFDYVE